jgi:hypothetical protein
MVVLLFVGVGINAFCMADGFVFDRKFQRCATFAIDNFIFQGSFMVGIAIGAGPAIIDARRVAESVPARYGVFWEWHG